MKTFLLSFALFSLALAPVASAEALSDEEEQSILATDLPPIIELILAYQNALAPFTEATRELNEAPYRNDLEGGLARAEALVVGADEALARLAQDAAALDFSRLRQTRLRDETDELERSLAEFPAHAAAIAGHERALAAALAARDGAAFRKLSAEAFALNGPQAGIEVAVNRALLLRTDPASPQHGVIRSYFLTAQAMRDLAGLEDGPAGMARLAETTARSAREIETEIRASEAALARLSEELASPGASPRQIGGRPPAEFAAELTTTYRSLHEAERGFAALFRDYATVAQAALDGANPQLSAKRFFDLDRRLPVLHRKRAQAAAAAAPLLELLREADL